MSRVGVRATRRPTGGAQPPGDPAGPRHRPRARAAPRWLAAAAPDSIVRELAQYATGAGLPPPARGERSEHAAWPVGLPRPLPCATIGATGRPMEDGGCPGHRGETDTPLRAATPPAFLAGPVPT